MTPLKFRAFNKLIGNGHMDMDGEYNLERFFAIHCSAGSDSIIMQFSGLTDKNGKEIYESDIVQDEEGNRLTIEWDDKFSCFTAFLWDELPTKDGGGCGTSLDITTTEWVDDDSGEFCLMDHCECIGNIHETPEADPAFIIGQT